MSTILIGALVIAGAAAICLFIIFINTKNSRLQNKQLLEAFNGAAAAKGVAFSSQEILKNKIIGLDGLHRQLLIFNIPHTSNIVSINLTDIKSCKLKKEYGQVDFGNEKKPDIELELRSINIRFTFKSKAETYTLSFYDYQLNSIYEMKELEAKARHWETLLSKMIWEEVATAEWQPS